MPLGFSAGNGMPMNGNGKYLGTQLSTISSASSGMSTMGGGYNNNPDVPVVVGQLPNGQLIYAPQEPMAFSLDHMRSGSNPTIPENAQFVSHKQQVSTSSTSASASAAA